MKKILFLLVFFLTSAGSSLIAQGSLCSDIEPFCAGDERLTFPNSNYTNSSQLSGEIGPDYGCLDEQPYPAWFFLQIEDSGNLNFRISQNSNQSGNGAFLDVDFVVWGPFSRNDDYCNPSSLSEENIVDCSYLPDAIETMSIPGAQENEIYVVLITNFEQVPGFITLEQTNTAQGGSTDCSILEFDLGDSISVCDEDEYVLDGTTDEDAVYQWYVFNENTSEYDLLEGETGPFLTITENGKYKLIATDLIEDKTEEDEVTVTFYDSPLIAEAPDLPSCDSENANIDLTQNNSILNALNSSDGDYDVQFFESALNAEENVEISNPQNYPFEDGKTIYARIIDLESGCFSELTDFQLTTFDFPQFELPEITVFCVDANGDILAPVSLNADLGSDYNYQWFADGNLLGENSEITIQEFPASEEIELIISHPESGCVINYSSTAVKISKPQSLEVEISGSDFGDGYVVTATPLEIIGEEFASFEYRIDNGSWQQSNIFENVAAGNHTVFVRETNGCGETSSESFFLVGYPRFFTPNSDGYNDTWKLITDENITIQNLYVFDRYGKLIIQLNPQNNLGWDGTFNGKRLPAADYWFRIEFIDEKTGGYNEYMANFTLIR